MISNLEQIKALAHPLRLKILQILTEQLLTTRELAKELEENQANLYRHLEILTEANLIHVVKTEQKRGAVEKWYQAVARDIRMDRNLLSTSRSEGSNEALYEMVNSFFQVTLSELRQSIANKAVLPSKAANAMTMYFEEISASKEEIERLREALKDWLAEFESADREDGEASYRLALTLFPTINKP